MTASSSSDPFAGSQMEATIARVAAGNWDAFPPERLPEIWRAAQAWKTSVEPIAKPWLCWCVSEPWCVLQQRLVQAVGWTPVVGHDTNIAMPPILPGSVYINFNAELQMPRCLMYFVLEWIFLYAQRLAFWHVDMLLSLADMQRAAGCFATLPQGSIALPWNRANGLLKRLAPYRRVTNDNRLFEVVGCVTRDASAQMYAEGKGFWRNPQRHPNNTTLPPSFPYWEHTVGLTLWAKQHPTQHVIPQIDIKTGHAATWKHKGLGRTTAKQTLLDTHTSLRHYAQTLGIAALLP